MSPVIQLSFDVEEFDMPLEYGQQMSMDEQLELGLQGLAAIKPILDLDHVRTTLFVTGNFANHNTQLIKELSTRHEIASHTQYHSSFKIEDLRISKETLERICGQEVVGLRMPRMKLIDPVLIRQAGYCYDASVHPTYIPGRYNNWKMPRTMYYEHELLRVPASVSPYLRIPLFWLSFKNFPFWIYKELAYRVLGKDGYLSLYFHPWEFVQLDKYQIPGYTKRLSGQGLQDRLSALMESLKGRGVFTPMKNFLMY